MVGWWCKTNGQTVHLRGLLCHLPCRDFSQGNPEVTQDFLLPSLVSCPLQAAGSSFLQATGSDKYRHQQDWAIEVPVRGANYGVIIS